VEHQWTAASQYADYPGIGCDGRWTVGVNELSAEFVSCLRWRSSIEYENKSAAEAPLRTFALAFGGAIALTCGIYALHMRIDRRIDELERL
jgi:hypothetical protein